MQAAAAAKDPVAVILDCEIGRTPDNALTLALLYALAYSEPAEAEFVSASLTRSSLQGAAFADSVARFYTRHWLRDYPERYQRYRGLSPGLNDHDAPGESQALARALDRKTAEGATAYPHEIHDIFETADPLALIRNGLTGQPDGSAVVVLAGAATNLAGTLRLHGARELIRAKAALLVVAMDQEQISADLPAARKLFAEWPTPIIAVKPTQVRFPADLSFEWADSHPVGDALSSSGSDFSTAGLAAALYAVRSDEASFELSSGGELEIDENGRVRLLETEGGDDRLLDASNNDLATVYREIITSEPAARELPGFLKRRAEEEAKEKDKG